MFPAPSVRETVSSKGCVIPGTPAVPRNSAYSDQANAAIVPRETRVSIVAVPWRRFIHAARWKGQAPQTTTGAARGRGSDCAWGTRGAGGAAAAQRRGAVAQVHPRGAVEGPGPPDHHGCGEGEGQPLPVGELQRRHHAPPDDRQAAGGRDDH